jgi:O-acetylserine/cysteine efflux transporter
MSPRDLILALGVVVIWGLNFVAIKWGVDEVPPFMLTALRYLGCALPAVFFIRRPKVSWRLLVLYGFTVGVLQFSFLFTAMRLGMPAGLASLVMQMQVFFTMALAVLFLGERPGLFQLGGALVALMGLATIGAEHLGGAVLVPLVMTLIAAAFWALSNIVTKRAGQVDMLAFVVWGSLVPPIPMLILSLIFEGPGAYGALLAMTPRGIFSVLFIAYGSTLFGYGLWGRAAGTLSGQCRGTLFPAGAGGGFCRGHAHSGRGGHPARSAGEPADLCGPGAQCAGAAGAGLAGPQQKGRPGGRPIGVLLHQRIRRFGRRCGGGRGCRGSRGIGRNSGGLQAGQFAGRNAATGIDIGAGEFGLGQVGPDHLQFAERQLAIGVGIDIGEIGRGLGQNGTGGKTKNGKAKNNLAHIVIS